jgi:hypothetical protein
MFLFPLIAREHNTRIPIHPWRTRNWIILIRWTWASHHANGQLICFRQMTYDCINAELETKLWGQDCPYGFHQQKKVHSCRGSVTASSKFLGLRAEPRTVAQTGVHRIYTGWGLRRVTPYVQFVLLYYLRWFYRGLQIGERGSMLSSSR